MTTRWAMGRVVACSERYPKLLLGQETTPDGDAFAGGGFLLVPAAYVGTSMSAPR
ncbi:hypothetical protein [Streptomyces sporangiiformans]|uniref:hypothetical protein n=1 Tax=Streptomyces sporangiiformans TaxID=2315329 RepID=UPI0013C3FA8B|nr:hypothetical protein [Streptomyces sporangiiformans]